jgi:hypothetical protein
VGVVVSFPRMPGTPEHRTGVDRRSRPRGGRRAGDAPGFAPLVLLLDEDEDNGARCEAILAKLRFAVAPARTIEEAIRVMAALRPNIVVARVTDEKRLRQATPSGVPLVILTDEHAEPEAMLTAIRKAIRTSRQS